MFRLDSPVMAHERQEALYVLLLSLEPDEWISLRRVADAMKGYYPDNTLTNFHNSTARRWITKDIEAINASSEYEKVIVSGSSGVKLATKEDLDDFLKAEYAEVFKKLGRIRRVMKKGNADQQMAFGDHLIQAYMGGD